MHQKQLAHLSMRILSIPYVTMPSRHGILSHRGFPVNCRKLHLSTSNDRHLICIWLLSFLFCTILNFYESFGMSVLFVIFAFIFIILFMHHFFLCDDHFKKSSHQKNCCPAELDTRFVLLVNVKQLLIDAYL